MLQLREVTIAPEDERGGHYGRLFCFADFANRQFSPPKAQISTSIGIGTPSSHSNMYRPISLAPHNGFVKIQCAGRGRCSGRKNA
jgi:hypothetical protein